MIKIMTTAYKLNKITKNKFSENCLKAVIKIFTKLYDKIMIYGYIQRQYDN